MAGLSIEELDQSNIDQLVDMFGAVDARLFPHATRDAALRFLEEPEDIHVLGRVNGRVVAFGMLRGWAEGYDVPSLGIAIAAGEEGHGYGRALMNVLASLARGRGATRIRLRVAGDNIRAQRLYRSCGYREAGIERGQTLMVLDLS
jgi:ribosomal protein S18 acetylase RimI-like enzyme